jgi:hypothetical protein
VPVRQLDELAARGRRGEQARALEDGILAAGREQHLLLWRMSGVGVGVAQPHPLGERDESTQVVSRDALGERDVVARDPVFDGNPAFGVGARLVDLQPGERAAVGDAAEHGALDVLGRVHRQLPAHACSQRVARIEDRVEQVRVEHRHEIADEGVHRVGARVVRLVAGAVAPLIDAQHAEAPSGEVAHPAGAHPVVATARGEPVDAQHRRAVPVAPPVRRDPVALGGHHILRRGHLRKGGERGIHAPILPRAAAAAQGAPVSGAGMRPARRCCPPNP